METKGKPAKEAGGIKEAAISGGVGRVQHELVAIGIISSCLRRAQPRRTSGYTRLVGGVHKRASSAELENTEVF